MFSVATLALFLTAVNGHSWIEQLTVVAPNGTFVGAPGFIRGNVLRSSPGFGDPLMVNLIPPNGRANNEILPTDLMCKPSQQTDTQTDGSPRLQTAPGATIALRYQENGHVTLPQNQPGKPEKGGNMYVYGTTDPQPSDTYLGIHKQWNADGSGGDKRGRLLSVSTFDDGRCYQVNGGQISTQRQKEFPHTASQLMGGDIWCQQDLALPTDAPTGKPYTLYWVWDWPTSNNNQVSLNESYTSCLSIDVGQSQIQSQKSGGDSFIQNQDLNFAAIPDQMAKLENGNAAPVSASSPSSSSTTTTPVAVSSASSQSTPSSAATPVLTTPAPSAPAPSTVLPISEQSSGSVSVPVVPAPSSVQSSAAPIEITTSTVLPAISAMNQPTGPSEPLVTVTVTDYVPAATATASSTHAAASPAKPAVSPAPAISIVQAPAPGSANSLAGLGSILSLRQGAVEPTPTNYRLRVRGASLTTVVVPEPTQTQSKRFYTLPSSASPADDGVAPTPSSNPAAEAEKNSNLVAALENLKDVAKSAKFAPLRDAYRRYVN